MAVNNANVPGYYLELPLYNGLGCLIPQTLLGNLVGADATAIDLLSLRSVPYLPDGTIRVFSVNDLPT